MDKILIICPEDPQQILIKSEGDANSSEQVESQEVLENQNILNSHMEANNTKKVQKQPKLIITEEENANIEKMSKIEIIEESKDEEI